jgi:hypothetical protein
MGVIEMLYDLVLVIHGVIAEEHLLKAPGEGGW